MSGFPGNRRVPRRPPPWWPEGERWPPAGPPWRAVPRRFRRRFLVVSATAVAAVLAAGIALGFAFHRGQWGGPWNPPGQRRGPGPLLGFVAVVAVAGGLATARAYRRVAQPAADLLGAAERLAAGDYAVAVEPRGPRELRSLTVTFNDMAARLAAAEDERRRFLADVTHELRTPLAVLRSGLEAQLDGVHPRDDRHLASLLEETEVLGRLVDDLHTLALADAGRLVLHRERVGAVALAEDAAEAHRALAAAKEVAVLARAGGGAAGVEVDADPTRVRQVLANLLSNAVRQAPAGTEVAVAVDVEAGAVRYTVTDAGAGFPPERLAGLFDAPVAPSDARRSGLGLTIAARLVAAHGGTIAASNRPAGGAAVTFTLPLDAPPSR